MAAELQSALCLMLVLEGILLFVAPTAWKDTVLRLGQMHDRELRRIGFLMMLLGVGLLRWLRS